MKPALARFLLATACTVLIAIATACHLNGNEDRTPGRAHIAPILLFTGAGTSPADVASIKMLLSGDYLSYSTANSEELSRLSDLEIRQFRLLIVPGGNFEEIGNGLTSIATSNIRRAIHDGLNYLGICAGAFFAGNSPYNGLNLTSGVRFGFYSAETQGIRKTVVSITNAGGATLDQYWQDGPQLAGWGAVVAKYPDGAPAIVQGSFGNGWIVLTGVHPEAPANWRRGMDFRTPVSLDNAYAAKLIRSALNRQPLPHY